MTIPAAPIDVAYSRTSLSLRSAIASLAPQPAIARADDHADAAAADHVVELVVRGVDLRERGVDRFARRPGGADVVVRRPPLRSVVVPGGSVPGGHGA